MLEKVCMQLAGSMLSTCWQLLAAATGYIASENSVRISTGTLSAGALDNSMDAAHPAVVWYLARLS